MNPLRLTNEIIIRSTNNDPIMFWYFSMQFSEIFPVYGYSIFLALIIPHVTLAMSSDFYVNKTSACFMICRPRFGFVAQKRLF